MDDGVLIPLPVPGEHGAPPAAGAAHGVAQPSGAVSCQIVPHQQHLSGVPVLLCQQPEQLLLQTGAPGLQGENLPALPLHGLGGVAGLHRQLLSDGPVLLPAAAQVGHGPAAAHQLQPHPLPELLAGEKFHQPHLPAAGDMGAAAGA